LHIVFVCISWHQLQMQPEVQRTKGAGNSRAMQLRIADI